MRALGFRHEGTLRQRRVARGVPYDTQIYGCLASEWPPHEVD
jgi:RimJ/RimL family protein N-acetyltransferase